MNVLYINHYAGSPEMGMEFRPYYLSREWVKMGHNVRIVGGDYSHLRLKNPIVKRDFQTEEIDGIQYTWLKTGSYEGNGSARAFSIFRFVWKLWKSAKRISHEWQPDVVITSSTYPLDTFAGQRIKKYSKAKLIHEIHDMWPITLIELGGMKRSHPFVRLMQIGENSFCKHSDKVVSILPAAKEYLVQHGMSPEKFVPITNGIVLSEWDSAEALPEEHQRLLEKLHEQKRFIICFFGSITKSYALDYMVAAMSELKEDPVDFVVVGEGNQKKELESIAGSNVHFLPKIAKKSIPTLLEQVDCCYVGALKNKMFSFGIGMNKLFDSMMSGRPILYAVDAPNNYIRDFDCGVSVEPENVEALVDGVKTMLQMDDNQKEGMGQRGRNAVINYFTYQSTAKQFEGLFI